MTRNHFAIQRSLERDGSEIVTEDAWLAKVPAMSACLAETRRYQTDPEYAAAQDADRADRQAAVYDKMDAGVARFWAGRKAVS
ncbi:hypothetical protein D3Y57_19040 [Sphingomonas paeninsulae]|uniref:Uncharacterized protein n=1 Tax=Sphingomonas paeninsulae TaxID=2319844 RepID=A0A494TKS4_SPHPE|nr:hypothetical protein [Sphingomonas paeninsulae]AYJ87633.1 hypothetical protein D3Y57_19040 [Sphingomonas paeninsulae]